MPKIGGQNNKEKCKQWRENLKKDQIKLQKIKLKNRERARMARQKWKVLAAGNNEMIEARRQYDRIRKREYRKKLAEKQNAEKNKST